MRLGELDRARLDRLAKARGLSRSELVRQLLAKADGAAARPGAPSRLEVLELFAAKARGGSLARRSRSNGRSGPRGEPAKLAPVKTGPVRLEELTADEPAG
jgi:Ribbon-helix-helix protein, copG family